MTRHAADQETLLAELTDAAYRVALGHGPGDSFLDLELGLWSALRDVLEESAPANRERLMSCVGE